MHLYTACKIATKPVASHYPDQLESWGDHLRKKRLDLELEQKDVAKLIGVSEESIYNWENHRTTPRPRYLPKIIAFLGYIPYDPGLSPGERLRYMRQCLGYSQAAYARHLGIDPGTLGKWERT